MTLLVRPLPGFWPRCRRACDGAAFHQRWRHRPAAWCSVSVTDRPSRPIASSVRTSLRLSAGPTFASRAGQGLSQSCDLRIERTGFSHVLISWRPLRSARTSSLKFRRFASTSLDGRSTLDNVAITVIVATTFLAKIVDTRHRDECKNRGDGDPDCRHIDERKRSTSRELPPTFAAILFRSGSDKNAYYCPSRPRTDRPRAGRNCFFFKCRASIRLSTNGPTSFANA